MRLSDLRIGMLLYFVGVETLHAMVLDQNGAAERFRLGSWVTLFPAIDALHERIEHGWRSMAPPSAFRDFAEGWGQSLLPPVEALRRFDVLVIIPHHALHGLPLHCIRLGPGGESLGTVCGVTYCSSASLLARCTDRNLARHAGPAAWDFAIAPGDRINAPEAPRRCVGIGADIIGEHTDIYAQLAKEFARSFAEPSVFTPATRAAAKIRLKREPRWEAVCIVCHGYYDAEVATRSGLLLEQDMGVVIRPIPLHRGRYYDFRDLPFAPLPTDVEQPSRAAELMTVGELGVDCLTDAQLVALFGCSTGAGHVVSGDDFDSMAYQWLKIGAASTLANLWQVDHEFLQRWSPMFLDGWLKHRQPKAIAWRESLRAWLQSNPDSDVAEWGAVALFGDWL